MLDLLRSWFNGSRDYHHGVKLFHILSDDPSLKSFFSNNASDYTARRLHEEMEKLYNKLKQPELSIIEVRPMPQAEKLVEACVVSKNPDLEQVCDQKALQLYKQMMNDRAILFNLTKVEGWDDVNKPDLVEQRRVLALQICSRNYEVSQAYTELEHVRLHGTLPSEEQPESEKEISDLQLKRTIDNLRTSLSKLRKREQTPERVAIIQKHQGNLDSLLLRWNAIKSANEE